MQVEFSQPAEEDLVQITLHIWTDNPDRALTFSMELEDACMSLSDHPLRHPVIAKQGGFDVHRFTYGNYNILYQLENDSVFVLRIVHGAMDIEKLIGEV